jgi:DNA (cytosine-5)-methyltransferase 1
MINTVRVCREEKMLTQDSLAKSVGVSRRSIVSIESGQSIPSVDIAMKISQTLDVPIEQLFITENQNAHLQKRIFFIDLFCGIGGFRYACNRSFEKLGIEGECVFSSDIDEYARESYNANFGEYPSGDITKIDEKDIPNHDLLLGGFPCQPFSIIGLGKGFNDTRGTLFFDIARILKEKKPKAFVLENVKRLVGHNGGKTFATIMNVLKDLGYYVDYKVLNALDCGLPQKRERVVIVGSTKPFNMKWPEKIADGKTLKDILETDVPKKYFASDTIINKRKAMHKSDYELSVWHENKAGNISSYPYSCALRAGASYNYLLVNGERRFTPRELLRLQGFPDSFKIVVNDSQIRKQTGNAVPVDLISCVLDNFIPIIFND